MCKGLPEVYDAGGCKAERRWTATVQIEWLDPAPSREVLELCVLCASTYLASEVLDLEDVPEAVFTVRGL